jgi:hypothetical protein
VRTTVLDRRPPVARRGAGANSASLRRSSSPTSIPAHAFWALAVFALDVVPASGLLAHGLGSTD